MVVKFLNLFFILVVSSHCYSQQWMLTLRPYVGGPTLSTQKNKIVMDNNVNFSNFMNVAAYSFTDNLSLSWEYNWSLLVDIYRFKNNWRLGLGFSVYGGSQTFLKAEAFDAYTWMPNQHTLYGNNIVYSNSHYENLIAIGPLDFEVFALFSKDLNIELNTRINQVHSFSLGFGATNMKASYDMEEYNLNLGKTTYKKYTSHKILPFSLLRYEVLFLSRKKKNLFSLALTYQQGFFKVARMEMLDVYNVGPYTSQSATSRGSSFYLSLSRPFSIISGDKSNKQLKL